MKKITEPKLKVIKFESMDVIATSGGNMKPGWGHNKYDNGTIDGHSYPPGLDHRHHGNIVW